MKLIWNVIKGILIATGVLVWVQVPGTYKKISEEPIVKPVMLIK